MPPGLFFCLSSVILWVRACREWLIFAPCSISWACVRAAGSQMALLTCGILVLAVGQGALVSSTWLLSFEIVSHYSTHIPTQVSLSSSAQWLIPKGVKKEPSKSQGLGFKSHSTTADSTGQSKSHPESRSGKTDFPSCCRNSKGYSGRSCFGHLQK